MAPGWDADVPQKLADERTLQDMVDGVLAILESSTSYTLGFVPGRPTLLGLFAHMFVHAGWFHLVGNLLFFFVVGPYLEEAYGWIFPSLRGWISRRASMG